jgi:hypothetical protein
MAKNQVTLTFAGDEKDLSRAFDKLGGDADKFTRRVSGNSDAIQKKTDDTGKFMSRTMSSAFGNMIASASAFAADKALQFFSGMITEARDAEKVMASTAQGIKTMGASAWTSADQVAELAESISNKIGVDDELIQQSANLLLTFGNIKNAVGENNNVFDRATLAAQDLAAKGFGDADASAKMLGKALNDPIKGITALSKAGVTFTQSQKDQIKAMVESGDMLGAQKIILGELERQVGGTAEATATAGDKMATTWGNFQEDLGTAILPILDDLLGRLTEFLDWAGRNKEIVIAFGAVTAAVWALNIAMNANPFVLIVTLILAVVAALIYLWNTNEGFRNAVTRAWDAVSGAFSLAGKIIGAIIGGIGGAIGWLVGKITWLVDRLRDAVEWARDLYDSVMRAMGAQWSASGGNFGKAKRHHTGGEVTGGIMGQEVLRTLQVGERVVPRGQDSGGGGGTITLRGNVDSLFATYLQKLIRDGVVTVS